MIPGRILLFLNTSNLLEEKNLFQPKWPATKEKCVCLFDEELGGHGSGPTLCQ
jgi:hypothetical protein